MRCAPAALAVLATLGGFASVAFADNDLQPPTQAPADIQIRFHEPLRLAQRLDGQVRSKAATDYHGAATISVGGKVVTRPEVAAGRATTTYRRLHVSLTRAQERKVIAAACSAHRRAVLGVKVTGTLAGHRSPSSHLRNFIVTVHCT